MATLFSHPAKSLVRLGALASLLVSLPGCQNIQTTALNSAGIRFVNASPDPSLPGLDIYQNNTALLYNLGFGSRTSYIPVTSGIYTFEADANNSTGTRQPLISAKQTVAAPKQYTAIIGNVGASLQETIYTDQGTPAPTGQVAIRFIDQSTRIGAVDIYVVPSSGKLITTAPVATNVIFTANTSYINVPADTYAIAVVPTGTVPVATTITLYTGPQIGYAAGAVRSYVLIDSPIVTTPAVGLVELKDYDSPNATS